MDDLVIYCADTTALVAAVRATWPERLDDADPDNPRFLLDKSPTVRKGAETLALVRCRPDEPEVRAGLETLAAAGVITIVGTWEDIHADPARQALVGQVYDRTPYTITDENGDDHTVTPPAEFARFF